MKRQQPSDIEVRWNALHTRIQSHADQLATQGRLELKRSKHRRYWVVRFAARRDAEGRRR